MSKVMRTSRGFSYLEVLVATLLLAIVATAAFASWSMAGRVTTAKRITEMLTLVGTSEIERLKAQTYNALALGTSYSWYDAQGSYLSNTPTATAPGGAVYKSVTVLSGAVPSTVTNTTRDLIRVQVTVSNVNNTSASGTWTCQTLLTFDGI